MYYAWHQRKPSQRVETDAALSEELRALHAASRGTYGTPWLHFELAEQGIRVGRKRVARLLLAAGLAGVSRRRFVTTTRRSDSRPAPDLVERKFVADQPNSLWVADITYIPTWVGFLYLAVVLDAFSRRIVGWSFALTLHARIVLDALDMALGQRKPDEVIHHSDQGSQYTSLEFGRLCREAGVRPSMGSVGDCYDNAMAESFFATLECELLDRSSFRTQAEARLTVFDFIEGFYNRCRRHSALGYRSPAKFERLHAATKPGPPGALDPATGLACVEMRPGNAEASVDAGVPADPDKGCARRLVGHAGRDGKRLPAEQKEHPGQDEKEDAVPPNPL